MELGHVGTKDKQTRSSDQWLSVHFLTWEGKKSLLIQIKRDRSRQGSLVPNQSTTLTASDNRGQSGKLKKPCRHEGALGHPTWNVASGLHLGRALYWVFPFSFHPIQAPMDGRAMTTGSGQFPYFPWIHCPAHHALFPSVLKPLFQQHSFPTQNPTRAPHHLPHQPEFPHATHLALGMLPPSTAP